MDTVETLDAKITEITTIAGILGDNSLNHKLAQLQRQKEILQLRQTIVEQQSANSDKKEELITFLGEDYRSQIKNCIVCDAGLCANCICCKVENYKNNGLTSEQIIAILF